MSAEITREQKRKALRREIALRRNVYAKKVKAGGMKQADADFELAVMEAILADYQDDQ